MILTWNQHKWFTSVIWPCNQVIWFNLIMNPLVTDHWTSSFDLEPFEKSFHLHQPIPTKFNLRNLGYGPLDVQWLLLPFVRQFCYLIWQEGGRVWRQIPIWSQPKLFLHGFHNLFAGFRGFAILPHELVEFFSGIYWWSTWIHKAQGLVGWMLSLCLRLVLEKTVIGFWELVTSFFTCYEGALETETDRQRYGTTVLGRKWEGWLFAHGSQGFLVENPQKLNGLPFRSSTGRTVESMGQNFGHYLPNVRDESLNLQYVLAHLLAFYLAYLLAFYLAYLLAYVLAFYLANLLAYVLANILALYLAYLLAFYLTFYLAYLLAFYLAYLLAFYLANILALYLAYLLAFFLTFYLAFYLAYLLAFYLAVEVQRWSLSSEGPRLRSSGAHWARRVPGWGPAVLTELGRSQVEVQRCPVRSDPCSWGPAVPTACGSWGRAWRRVGKAAVNMEVEAEVVEEKEEEEEKKRRRTTLIKSNNSEVQKRFWLAPGSGWLQSLPSKLLQCSIYSHPVPPMVFRWETGPGIVGFDELLLHFHGLWNWDGPEGEPKALGQFPPWTR